MTPTGTHFNYYQLCHRKLWLFANGINMEHTSDTVYDGKLIHESCYPQRSERMEEVMERKDNTLKFTPFAIDEDGTEHPGQPRYLPVEDISEFYCFGSLKANSSLFNFLGQKDICVQLQKAHDLWTRLKTASFCSSTLLVYMDKDVIGKERSSLDIFL